MKRFILLAVFSVIAAFLLSGNLNTSDAGGQHFMAVCNNGDGTLSHWVTKREEALLIASDHQKQFNGHHVEVISQGVPLKKTGEQACFTILPTRRNDVVRIENECDSCRNFTIERKTDDSQDETISMSFEPGKRKFFKTNGGEVTITGEGNCE